MRELIIQKNDADQRVDKFLGKSLKKLPKSLMYKYIRNKKIKVNKKRCEISQRLQEGDVMQLYIAEEFFEQEIDEHFLKVPAVLNILYEDEHLLVVDKEKGLLAHSDRQGQDNLIDRIKHYLYIKHEYDPHSELSFAPSLCHRIDRNTQGIVIAAKNAEALREMNQLIKDRHVEKKYLCIVEGRPVKERSIVKLYHKKLDGNQADIINYPKDGYQEAITAYRVVETVPHHSLLEIDLLTGRSHQIRASMAYLKHPLLGDQKYGAKKSSYPYQALCAYKVIFHVSDATSTLHYLDGKKIEIMKVELRDVFHKLS